MKKIICFFVGFILFFSLLNIVFASIPNHDHPTTFLGPTAKGKYTSPLTDNTAFSIAGEAGIKNFRIGGTLGWKIQNNQRLKFSGEYLWQRITYPFFSGNTDQWVDQGAIGAAYQLDFDDYCFRPQFDLSAYYSHAPNKNLSEVTGTILSPSGIIQNFVNVRRIAGSNAAGVSPGVNFHPWLGGLVGLELNYDNVHYTTNYRSKDDAIGLGGTVRINQFINDNIVVGASAAFRQPFNNYQANVTWVNIPYYGSLAIGLDAAYTIGKNELPNTYNVSASASYSLDAIQGSAAAQQMANQFISAACDREFMNWVSDPAVYMPQVLAIPDENLLSGCAQGPVTLLSPFADIPPNPGGVFIVASAPHFAGSSLSYSITTTPTGPSSVTIDPTGVITITAVQGADDFTFTVTVTAANQCGSASSSFDVTVTGS